MRAAALEWNLASPHVANGVVQILFDREPAAVARAHRMREQARGALAAAGFPAYRSDIDHAERAVRDRGADDGVLAAASRIKQALDPRGVIAPARYLPADTARSEP